VNSLTKEELKELKEKASKATPVFLPVIRTSLLNIDPEVLACVEPLPNPITKEQLTFIEAAQPSTVLRLIEMVEWLQESTIKLELELAGLRVKPIVDAER